MNEICLVFTWNREELLWLSLEAIRREEPNMPLFVFSDRGAESDDLWNCCNTFQAQLIIRPPHRLYGNSWNVLDACKWWGVANGNEIVHLVEDDTIVHHGWFAWARQTLAHADAVCARIHGDPATVWIESPCVSWNAKALAQCLSAVPEGYFCETRAEMQRIVDAAFSESKYRYGSAEQDGLLLRCVERFKLKTKWPPHCYATHLGAAGYNRPGHARPQGTFEERIAYYRALKLNRNRRVELFGARITDLEMAGEALCEAGI